MMSIQAFEVVRSLIKDLIGRIESLWFDQRVEGSIKALEISSL